MAIKRKTRPNGPGFVLRHVYMEDHGVNVTELAGACGVSRKHMSDIVNGHKRVEAEMAMRLAKVFDTSSQVWMNLQNAVDLWDAEAKLKKARWKPAKRFGKAA